MKIKGNQGFTLVELAVVMILIGLLTGMVLKGQTLLRNSRITGTIAQVESYKKGTAVFLNTYQDLPGDLPYAADVLPDCPLPACAYKQPTYSNDNMIGYQNWALHNVPTDAYPQQGGNMPSTLDASSHGVYQIETVLFWTHLALAKFIDGVIPAQALTATGATTGVTHPAAKIGGTFWVGYAKDDPAALQLPGFPGDVTNYPPPKGLWAGITKSATQGYVAAAGSYPMTVLEASIIDRKMDDGAPGRGIVRGFGRTDCFLDANNYSPASQGRNCSVTFQIIPPIVLAP